jgi:protein-S-isoprenylcysteine O-methyltransferase Ste14
MADGVVRRRCSLSVYSLLSSPLLTVKSHELVPARIYQVRPVLEFVVRSVIWIAAIAFWTSLNKPDDIPILPVWPEITTVIGAIIVTAGIVLYSAGALTLARAPRVAGDMPQKLLTEGPFAYVRNPIYLGACIVVVGLGSVYQMPVWSFVKMALLFTGAHLAVVLLEEPGVRKRFGGVYDDYCRRVPRWIPRLRA